MKLPSKNTPLYKRPAAWVITIVVLALMGAAAFYAWQSLRHSGTNNKTTPHQTTANYAPPTKEQTKAGEDIKKDVIEPPKQNTALNLTISRASQSSAGQPLSIRSVVGGTTSGECKITLSMAGQPAISKSVAIVPEATYYSCAPINIDASEFGSNGTWSLQAYISSGNSVSTTITMSVEIQK